MFLLHLDVSDLLKLDDSFRPAVDKAMKRAAETLAAQVHAHIVENVQQKLRSTRETYLDHLGFHQVNDNTWVVDLMPGALFIEEGMESHSMVDDLLDDSPRPGTKKKDKGTPKGKTKTAKDGSRYRVIPFEHNIAKTRQTQAATDLTNTIKSELKKMGAPSIGKLETDSAGKPKLGLVRSFDIMTRPVKTVEGPGQGKGPVGVVRQGPTGIPLLQGVRIYQRQVADKEGKSSVKKMITTFRVVSSKHKAENRWIHPGLEARKFMDEAATWALELWEQKIKPEVLEGLLTDL